MYLCILYTYLLTLGWPVYCIRHLLNCCVWFGILEPCWCCAHTGRQGSAGWTAEALGRLMLLSPFTCGCALVCVVVLPKTRVKRCAHRNSLSQQLLSKGLNCFPGGPSLTKAMTFSLVFARPAAEPCATGYLWRHWKFMPELLHWCSWWQLFHSLVLLCEDLCRTPGLGLALPNQGPLNSKKRYTGTDRCVSTFSQRHISPIVQSLVKWQPCSKLVAARPSTWQTA